MRTLADVIAHLGVSRQVGLLDAPEVRVRRPAAGRAGRQRFVSGKARANTITALVVTDPAVRPSRELSLEAVVPVTFEFAKPGRITVDDVRPQPVTELVLRRIMSGIGCTGAIGN